MSELDAWADVLPMNLRRVWPHVADCANRIGGALMGGTAVAIHLRHRVSEDLDVVTLRKFSGSAQAKRLRASASSVTIDEVADNMFHGFVDGVKVDIFRALPSDGVQPSQMHRVAPSITVEGMQVASIADLVAAKLDVIRFRPKLRDYLDLAAIDRSGACSLEAGLGYYCRRFGYAHPPRALEEIVTLLDRPGTLPADPAYEERRADALRHLRGRVPQLRDRIAEMRDVSVSEPTAASAQRARGESELH
ncbi:nucleotidyl transferase AbiEii/AbiGii toxin family protein [Candidatus Poriferisodalis sp.]|uniref:nucleotidyl transferase AbiEii/AbiGii toxin family protein n=1 Tax=Candidatus Poriferisodalis sp. TaxID=3101277 RepID=UPI003B016603